GTGRRPSAPRSTTWGPARCGPLRRARYCAVTLLSLFFLYLPLAEGGLYLLLTRVPALSGLLDPGTQEITSAGLYADALVISLVLFAGLVLAGLAFVTTVPR